MQKYSRDFSSECTWGPQDSQKRLLVGDYRSQHIPKSVKNASIINHQVQVYHEEAKPKRQKKQKYRSKPNSHLEYSSDSDLQTQQDPDAMWWIGSLPKPQQSSFKFTHTEIDGTLRKLQKPVQDFQGNQQPIPSINQTKTTQLSKLYSLKNTIISNTLLKDKVFGQRLIQQSPGQIEEKPKAIYNPISESQLFLTQYSCQSKFSKKDRGIDNGNSVEELSVKIVEFQRQQPSNYKVSQISESNQSFLGLFTNLNLQDTKNGTIFNLSQGSSSIYESSCKSLASKTKHQQSESCSQQTKSIVEQQKEASQEDKGKLKAIQNCILGAEERSNTNGSQEKFSYQDRMMYALICERDRRVSQGIDSPTKRYSIKIPFKDQNGREIFIPFKHNVQSWIQEVIDQVSKQNYKG